MVRLTLSLAFVAALAAPLSAQELTITDQIPGTYMDISSTGTALGLGDEGTAEITTPIDLTQTLFAGDGSGRVWVSNNGAVGFLGDGGSAGAFYFNTALPNFGLFGGAHGTPQALAVYWDDLDSDTGDVYYETIGEPGSRVLIIQWQDRPHYQGDPELDGDEATFQVQIFENATPGHAQFLYEDTDFLDPLLNDGGSATIGYQAGGIRNDVQWSFNQPGAVGAGVVLTLGEGCTTDDDCNDGNPCTADACDIDGTCIYTPEPESTPCDADDNVCTIDHCDGEGSCVFLEMEDCDDGNPCTEDSCDPVGQVCINEPLPESTPCDADENFCTIDHCDGEGSCVFLELEDCDDGNPCTEDSCDPVAEVCINEPLPESTPCELDGDICTIDHCDAMGMCVFLEDVDCEDGNVCTLDDCDPILGCVQEPAPESTPCEADENVCTIDHCNGEGECVFLEDVICDDFNDCTADACDPAVGCVHEPLPESTPCELDGDICTIDHCNDVGMCVFLEDVDCEDGNVCTVDACDPAAGCVQEPAPESTPCEADEDPCTADHCNGDGSCVFLEPLDCDDGDLCTEDGCDPGSGCTHNPLDCDDGNPCTDDACSAEVGCIHEPNTAPCDDADLCTEDDVCSGGACGGTPVTCPEGQDCDPDSGECVCDDCPTDVDGDNDTGPFDLAVLLGEWGACEPGGVCECLDADGDGSIGPFDLAFLLGDWGPCS